MSKAQTFRKLFLAATEELPDAPVFLSGGVDSATVLAAALALGRRPHCYTFNFGEYLSSDAKVARSMAEAFNLPFTLVTVPRDPDAMIADAKRVIRILQKSLKAHVQCSIPFLYLAPAATRDGFKEGHFGMGAGPVWGVGRHASVALNTQGEAAWTKYRRDNLHDPDVSDWSITKVLQVSGIAVHHPWRYAPFSDFMLSCTSRDLNAPKQKYIALAAFPEFWKRGAWYREGLSLQVVSGIREAHDTLLNHPINRRKNRAIVGLYNDFLREMQCQK